MLIKKSSFAILLTLLFGFIVVGVAVAQQPTPSDDQVNSIAKQLYCPVCENIPLDVCPTTACAQWRELIRQKLADGWSEQQIKDYFVQQYGARVLGTPPPKGINWLVYLVPPVAILAGVYVLYHAYRSWKRPTQQVDLTPSNDAPPAEMNAAQDEYITRLEDEVRKR
ncbi:MAG: cytochrome c-type biogenesis protein [Anaerolineales bacterium]